MRKPRLFQTVGALAVTLTAAGVSAQAVNRGAAVDPNVGDRGPNATSLRFVDPGNAQHSYAARVTTTDFRTGWSPFQATNPIATDPATGLPHSQGFQFTAPGVRALMDRPDYLVDVGGNLPGRNIQPNTDGAQSLIIPANTVFQLTLERQRVAPPAPAPVASNYVDLRVSPLPMQSTSLYNPVSFSRDGGFSGGAATDQIDASQLRFPAAALAGQPHAEPTAPAMSELSSEPEEPVADDTAESDDTAEPAAE